MSLGGMSIEKPQKPTATENHHVFGAGHVGPLCSTPARSRSLEFQVIGFLLSPTAPWNYHAFLHLKGVPGWKRIYYTQSIHSGSSMWVFWGVGQFSSIV